MEFCVVSEISNIFDLPKLVMNVDVCVHFLVTVWWVLSYLALHKTFLIVHILG